MTAATPEFIAAIDPPPIEPNVESPAASLALQTVALAKPDEPWVLAARAGHVETDDRAAFGDALDALGSPPNGGFVLATCHRVELYGVGPPPDVLTLVTVPSGLRAQTGRAAVAHLLRLSAGIESSVVGEDQILHQIRTAFREAHDRTALDPRLSRLVQVALRVGRRARMGWAPAERSLADRAIGRLEAAVGPLADRRVLIVGAGDMGAGLVRAAAVRRAHIQVASRELDHAQAAARAAGQGRANALDLAEASRVAPAAAAIAIALNGHWHELDAISDPLPAVIDLSSPSALSPDLRSRLGARFIGIDDLFDAPLGSWASRGRGLPAATDAVPVMDQADASSFAVDSLDAPSASPTATRGSTGVAPHDTDAFLARAGKLVQEAVNEYESWLATRRSTDTIRSLTERAETRRRDELDRLLRRLPDLDPRERDLVTVLSSQLVAALLHEPLARLREDKDGSRAQAAKELFGL